MVVITSSESLQPCVAAVSTFCQPWGGRKVSVSCLNPSRSVADLETRWFFSRDARGYHPVTDSWMSSLSPVTDALSLLCYGRLTYPPTVETPIHKAESLE